MKSIGYYPGCSLCGGGIELDMSIRAMSRTAGVDLLEIDDWNCCGASSAHSLNHELAIALPYRTLALAEQQGLAEVVAPCAACFSRLKGTNVRLNRSAELRAEMESLCGRPYSGQVKIVSITEYVNRLLKENLEGKLTHSLAGLKVAPYYGCLLSRGEDIVVGDDPEHPQAMEAAIRAAGAEVVEWNFATECCGGGFSMPMTDAVVELTHAILSDARAAGADVVVTGCPMCHSNLDMRQRTNPLPDSPQGPVPILYLSELVALAAGAEPKAVGLDRHFISATALAERSR